MVGISPSWVEPDGPLEPEPQELNPDCGHKSSIARCVSISPQRYSSSFGSQVCLLAAWQREPWAPPP